MTKRKDPAYVKSERILVRLTPDDKALIQKAADYNDRKLADWVRMLAVQQSRRAVENNIP